MGYKMGKPQVSFFKIKEKSKNMKRFFGMMPSSEVEKQQEFTAGFNSIVTVQAGKRGWAILYADSSSEYADLEDTTENNFDAAVKVLKGHFPEAEPVDPVEEEILEEWEENGKFYTDIEITQMLKSALKISAESFLDWFRNETDVVHKDTREVIENCEVDLKPNSKKLMESYIFPKIKEELGIDFLSKEN